MNTTLAALLISAMAVPGTFAQPQPATPVLTPPLIPRPGTPIPTPESLALEPEWPAETAEEHDARMGWWRSARFGMFIHWGLYAIPAGQWGGSTDHAEWIRTTGHIPLETYDQFVARFNPVNFSATDWARMAQDAGMGYIVITSKHHDGFALFDSAVSDFDIMATPFRRDILRELADATRAQGLRMCFYHSIMDWHHSDYLPRREWEADRPVDGADFDRFEAYLHAQVSELLTNYGPIGVMWFDGEWESTWNEERGRRLYALCRSLQPSVIVNNRVGVGREGMMGLTRQGAFGGDFGTPEQEVPPTGFPGVDWESCMTMNDHWGYNAFDHQWKSTTQLIRTLVDVASKGGNYLLNVGPRADGTFPPEAVDRLREIGEWMRQNGSAIHGTTASPFDDLPWGRCTVGPTDPQTGRSNLYLHVFNWPADGRLTVPGLANTPMAINVMGSRDGQAHYGTDRAGGSLVISGLQGGAANPHCSVIRLLLDSPPDVYLKPTIAAITPEFIDSLRITLAHPRSGVDDQGHDNLQLRYTVDGTDPTASSPAFDGPFVISTSTTIRVQAWRDGQPLSPIAQRRFERVTPVPAVTPTNPQQGLLNCDHYQGNWDAMPRFETLTPVKTEQTAGVTIETRTRDEHIAQVFTGYILVKHTAIYRFALSSDDGSRLYLHDRLVVDNDGLHATEERDGTIALAAGYHPIRVEYFNRSGGHSLALRGEQVILPLIDLPPGAFAIDGP